jgi:hypothetical protein
VNGVDFLKGFNVQAVALARIIFLQGLLACCHSQDKRGLQQSYRDLQGMPNSIQSPMCLPRAEPCMSQGPGFSFSDLSSLVSMWLPLSSCS